MEDKIYGIIYCIRNKVNGKIYIGQTKYSALSRYKGHVRDAYKSLERNEEPCYFHKAILKYGKDCFAILTIDKAFSKDELNFLEQYYIDFFSCAIKEVGYNLAMGGQFGSMNAETLEKCSKSKKAYWQSDRSIQAKINVGNSSSERNKNSIWMTNGTEDKLVLNIDIENAKKLGFYEGRRCGLFTKNRKGKIQICRILENGEYETKRMYPEEAEIYLNNGWEHGCGYTKNPSKETREKQRQAKLGKTHVGRHLTEEEKKHLSEINKGKVISKEVKDKISATLTGRIFTEDHRKKIGNSSKGRKLSAYSINKMKNTKRITSVTKQNVKCSKIDLNRLEELNNILTI